LKIAVVGAGGTGGFFGGCLARAGEDVTFIARGSHLEAIRASGLRVESASQGNFVLRPVQATDRPSGVGPVDLILLCVKGWDLDSAARSMRPMLGPGSTIIPVLNGVEAAERVSAAVSVGHVLGGVAYLESSVSAPGVIRHSSTSLDHLIFGELDGGSSDRTQSILSVLQRGGFHTQVSPTILKVLWSKFIFICGVSGVSAVTRLPVGVIRDTPETRRMVVRVMGEIEALARANGVSLDEDVVDQQFARFDQLGANAKPSMTRDLERGTRLELETLHGSALRLGSRLGVPLPTTEFIYASLKPYESGALKD
jgi:2-dehydropantoate 2-reductase